MNYDTFKQYMKRLAEEYKDKSFPTNYSFSDFLQWLTLISEPEKNQEEKWKPGRGDEYFYPDFHEITSLCDCDYWENTGLDNWYYNNGLCCQTPEEAIALAERMLEAIKN